jgi:hypothetical protein
MLGKVKALQASTYSLWGQQVIKLQKIYSILLALAAQAALAV